MQELRTEKVSRKTRETHSEKMQRKAKQRNSWYRSRSTPLVMANLSKNHPDYGMTPREHEAAKRARNSS